MSIFDEMRQFTRIAMVEMCQFTMDAMVNPSKLTHSSMYPHKDSSLPSPLANYLSEVRQFGTISGTIV